MMSGEELAALIAALSTLSAEPPRNPAAASRWLRESRAELERGRIE